MSESAGGCAPSHYPFPIPPSAPLLLLRLDRPVGLSRTGLAVRAAVDLAAPGANVTFAHRVPPKSSVDRSILTCDYDRSFTNLLGSSSPIEADFGSGSP